VHLERLKEELGALEESELSQKKEELTTTVKHLSLFLQQVDSVQAENKELEKRRHENGRATFEMLWMILHPGTFVYVSANQTEIAMRVRLLTWEQLPHHSAGFEAVYMAVTVHMWYLDHNGRPKPLSSLYRMR
jgi:hypothetical protein